MTDHREALEATIRRLMAKVAAFPSRGYDTDRVRQGWITEIDRLLDLHADPVSPVDGDPHNLTCSCGLPRVIVARQALWCEKCDAPSVSETHILRVLE